MKHILSRLTAVTMALILLLALVGCDTPAITTGDDPNSTTSTGDLALTPLSGVNLSWEEGGSTVVNFSGSTIAIDGNGASANGSTLNITQGGTYVLRGSLDGQVVVSAPDSATVRLVLDGVAIQSDVSAAIYCMSGDELVVILADGSTNTLTDAATYTYADTEKEEPDACLFSKVDMTIGGTGSLHVEANFYNGIGSKDDLVISGGTYHITAANNGIRGRDSLTVYDGDFHITAGNDGLQSNNSNGEDKGWIVLYGGNYTIESGHDGIQAESTLTVVDGTYTVTAGGGHSATVLSTESYKGLKAGTDITISGGTFAMDCADDTVHANGDIVISGGDLTLSTGDDGVHADGDLTITGGSIDIVTSYEGLEAMTMTLAGGTINIVASDDGINVAGGIDSSGMGGRFGGDSFDSGTSSRWLNITGGTITVNASGDGIDINGNGTMSGGTVYVNGPTSNMDAAVDFDGTFEITGGTLVAVGPSGMAQAPGDDSTQPVLSLYFTSQKTGGTTLEVYDQNGNVVLDFTPLKNFNHLVFSSQKLTQGQTYSVYENGELLTEITLEDIVTSVNDSGAAVTGFGGFGGGRGGGGMPGGQRPEGGTPPFGEMPTDGPGGMPGNRQ